MSITLDGTSGLTLPGANTATQIGSLTRTTEITTNGAASYDFTNIPSWVKRITVMIYGVSTNGTSSIAIRIGGQSGIVSTGYVCGFTYASAAVTTTTTNTTGFFVTPSSAAGLDYGSATITNISGNKWVFSGVFSSSVNTMTVTKTAGVLDLGEQLTQVRLTSLGGTDLFDAGTFNILYE